MLRLLKTYSQVMFMTLIIYVHTIPPSEAPKADGFRDSALIKKLNDFVSHVNAGFRSLGTSMRALKEGYKTIEKLDLVKLSKTLQFIQSLEPVCPTGWTKHNQRCFSFHNCTSSCTVNIAKLKCESAGGSLASVLSQDDNDLIAQNLGGKPIMLGGNDRENEGRWVWPDGSLIKDGFMNWYKGEPNTKKYDCMYTHATVWADCYCAHNYGSQWAYVCVGHPTYSIKTSR